MSYYKPNFSYNLAQNQNNMASAIDAYLAANQTEISEEAIGKQFANRIRTNLLASIRNQTNKGKSGMALKSTAKPVYKFGQLDRITLFTPYYIYPILDYGFEGTKSNGVNARMKPKNFLSNALENGKVVQDLADLIGNQRANAIVMRTDFAFDKDNNTSNSLGK